MDDYTILLDPETKMVCTLYLYKDVENSNEIRKKIMNGELCCSVIKASLVVDPLQLIVAANKAVISAQMNQLTTKSLYTEVLFNLSMSKNIVRTLTEFGISDNDKNLLIVLIYKKGNEKESVLEVLTNTIKGERISVSRLSEFTDIESIKKIYKIEKDELSISSLTNSIVSRISCKHFILLK